MSETKPTCPTWDAFLPRLVPDQKDREALSVPFRVTHRLFLLTNHKPSAELLGGGDWKLNEQRNS